MAVGLWRLSLGGAEALARGEASSGPAELLATSTPLDDLVAAGAGAISAALRGPLGGPVPPAASVLAPLGNQEVWAAGVTFLRSREARKEESGTPDPYDLVYEAERPELFLKAAPGRARGPGQTVGVRADSSWDVPEPELAVVADAGGRPAAYTIGDDVSSRSIEGENPLYLPQAKVYRASCAIGPCLVPVDQAPPLADMTVSLSITRRGAQLFSESAALSGLRRPPSELVAWLYRALDFPVGAALLTGTSIVPERDLTLRRGDVVTITITGLGRLVNQVEVVGDPAWVAG
ncbi:MAG: fumarylacetoacetate hydrolase family protein [Acidimicrobiales bacterium]